MAVQTGTVSLTVTNMASASLEFYESEFAETRITNYATTDMLVSQWDHIVSMYYSESAWCSTFPTAPTLTGGSVSGNWCFWWDDVMREKPFSPISSSCTDSG